MLGLVAPWKLESFEIDHAQRVVTLRLICTETVWGDPDTKQRLQIHSHEERRWWHLDFKPYQTVLIAKVQRVMNPETRKTQTVAVPWAGQVSRWVLAFEALALAVIQASAALMMPVGYCA